ncbi:endonuclease/exonuclease/phosphatase family protein [uncultured Parasphingopyxis sp.]|uniref:endonuclease/exonuclease/phosphatase family protein n=1 Tax=uncultured Parasphingopyxis sp. TaxID=1547918 RepID=UPI002635DC1D|nr:endonuclease/exonuclease/phosphatase family protein [uncultured Parasphingopyxis sp.]
MAIAMLAAVLISLIPSDKWFIRALDLVREPMSYLAGLLLLLSLLLGGSRRWMTIAACVLVIVINFWRIWPYSFLAETQLALGEQEGEAAAKQCFSAMSVNVKVENEQYALIINQVRRHDPDLLFLMETDSRWVENLEPLLSEYDHVDRHPQPDAFGLVFATRLPVVRTNVVENTHRDTPTLYATLQPAESRPIEFIGLHPKPPLPDWNTELRDENIANAGVQTPDRLPDAFVMGDFNDVPWSRTTTEFRSTGDWRDPRIGRGTYPTFPADVLLLGWPLDQLLVKGELEVVSFEILPDNGSDHRGILANICAPT